MCMCIYIYIYMYSMTWHGTTRHAAAPQARTTQLFLPSGCLCYTIPYFTILYYTKLYYTIL